MALSNVSEMKQTCFMISSYVNYNGNQAQPWPLRTPHAVVPGVRAPLRAIAIDKIHAGTPHANQVTTAEVRRRHPQHAPWSQFRPSPSYPSLRLAVSAIPCGSLRTKAHK